MGQAQIVDAHMHVFLQRKIFIPMPTYLPNDSVTPAPFTSWMKNVKAFLSLWMKIGIMIVVSPFHCINGFDEQL